MERTLAIVKPDGVSQKVIGEVISRFEQNQLKIIGIKMVHMSRKMAEEFYRVHKRKSFFKSLTRFMSSGPIVVMVLEGEKAIEKVRGLMGPTDSRRAPQGTIRGDYGSSIEKNIVHGSDSLESADFEIPYFFSMTDLCPH